MVFLANLLYLFLVIIFLGMGAAIIFHLLHYKINRRVSGIMFLIYMVGAITLLISNFILFRQIDWYQIFSSLNF